ncbi:MAG: hypothetical protein AAF204_01710 [Pseudomonadota bacterium]
MKHIWVFITAFMIALSGAAPTHAQDLFIKKERPSASVQTPRPEEQEIMELLDQAPKKEEAERPAPQSINDFANRYFDNCMKQQHPNLQGEQKELLCGCTAANIPGNMTVQNMRDMQQNTPEGATQRGRMLLFVYTPCIEYPTKALIYDRCVNDPQVRGGLKRYTQVCDCLSDGMAGFMKERAPKTVENALALNINDIDPLRVLMESKAFEEQSRYHMKNCVYNNELRR